MTINEMCITLIVLLVLTLAILFYYAILQPQRHDKKLSESWPAKEAVGQAEEQTLYYHPYYGFYYDDYTKEDLLFY